MVSPEPWYYNYYVFPITTECPPLPAIPNGIVSLSGVTAGSTASYICNAMYELVGPSTRVCMTDSTWSGQEPTCRRKLTSQHAPWEGRILYTFAPLSIALCPDLTDPANGAVMMMGNSVGDMATYTCNDGFELDGVMMVTCQSDGQWDNPPPICRSLEGKWEITYSSAHILRMLLYTCQ